ncbi:MAG TPA: hypothetical protein EYO59_12340, partial [Chromatiaceae bacterium]|nr:hypothetical protein [Chromatiaceae bacterium]
MAMDAQTMEYQYLLSEQNVLFLSETGYVQADARTLDEKIAQTRLARDSSASVSYTGVEPHTRVMFINDAESVFRPTFTIAAPPLNKNTLDGVYGAPFLTPYTTTQALHVPIYNDLDLTKWKIRVAIGYWGQESDDAGWTHSFDFAFPAGSKLRLVFDADGRGITQNVSEVPA